MTDPVIVLRTLKRELRRWLQYFAVRERRLDDRSRGNLEALRHVATVIENAERP